MPTAVTMSRKNQIVVPREAREKLHLLPGQQLLVLSKEDRIVLIPRPKNFTERMSGLHKEVWQGTDADEYIAAERDGWRK
jgi:AbrB family looped-hinge helix DNA binding protein